MLICSLSAGRLPRVGGCFGVSETGPKQSAFPIWLNGAAESAFWITHGYRDQNRHVVRGGSFLSPFRRGAAHGMSCMYVHYLSVYIENCPLSSPSASRFSTSKTVNDRPNTLPPPLVDIDICINQMFRRTIVYAVLFYTIHRGGFPDLHIGWLVPSHPIPSHAMLGSCTIQQGYEPNLPCIHTSTYI